MESTGAGSGYSSPMELLPTEILQKIMGYLPIPDRVRVEGVCKRWKNASTEAIWKDVQTVIIEPRSRKEVEYINTGNYSKLIAVKDNKLSIDILRPEIIESLVSRVGQYVKELIFDFQDQRIEIINTDIALSIVAVYCRNLEIIQLNNGEYLDVTILSMLLKINKKLHSIACMGTIDIINILPLKNWKSLYFGRPSDSDHDPTDIEIDEWEKKVATLIDHSPSLENFYVYDSGPPIITAISKCKNLKNLLFPMSNRIAAYNLATHTILLNRLTCLRIEGGGSKDNLIINSLRHCINVESLGLYYTRREIPIRVLHAVLDLPKLESLELECYFTAEIVNHLGKFKHLMLTDCFARENMIIGLIEKSEDLEILDVNLKEDSIEKLVRNTGNRRKILKLHVRSDEIYNKALEICRGSRIHVFQEFNDLMNNMRCWIPRYLWDNSWDSDSD